MATIEKRGRAYRIIFRHAGRKFSRSLSTTSERAAQASLACLEDNLRRVEIGTLTIPEGADIATFLLSDGRKTAKRINSKIKTLGELLAGYFDALPEGSLEESTVKGMKIHKRHFLRILGSDLRITSVQLDDLQSYVDKRAKEQGIRGRSLSPATIKKELRTLNIVWNWANENGIILNTLPKKRIRYPKSLDKPRFQTWDEIERKIERTDLTPEQEADLWDCLYLTRKQIDELLLYVEQHAAYPFIFPMFVFAAHTGARRSEIMRSELHDIDLSAKTITIREKKRVRGRLTTRDVPISPRLHEVLLVWLDEHPGGIHTFCQISGGSPDPISRDEASHHFRQTVAESKWSKLRGWHVFRHSFCSNCASSGIDQRFINAWVGHQTEDMVRRYRHLIPDDQRNALAQVFG